MFNYRAFGLNIASELECSGVLPSEGVPEVCVRLGDVPKQLAHAETTGVLYQANNRQFLLNVRDFARYLVSSGNEIIVDIVPGADRGVVVLLLFGSAFGALLQQRRILTMHGSAIVTTRGAIIFTGASGSGKSTLAAAFHQMGFPVLADDICPIDTSGSLPVVAPANPFLMLWADAASRLGIKDQSLRQTRSGIEKYVLPLGNGFASKATELRSVYLLETSHSEDFSLVPIRGLQKIKKLNLTSYRPHFIEGMNLVSHYVRQIGEVARQANVTIVNRPRGGFRVGELADFLATDFAV